jgi:hypothetical protein
MSDEERKHDARSARAAAAVPLPRSPSPAPDALPLFSLADVTACRNAPRRLHLLLRAHQLLLSPGAPCPICEGTLREYTDAAYLDGHRFCCTRCFTSSSIRPGSIFEHLHHTLFDLAQLITFFNARILVHQAEQLSGINRKRISEFFTRIRERCSAYIAAHPISFPADEIVEIDELYVKALREPATDEEKTSWPPIIGMIGRHTGYVALEITPTHSTADISAPILAHLPHGATVVFTDEAPSFNFLRRHSDHKQAWYAKRGGAKWLEPHREHNAHGEIVTVHTNTIEGYWSQFRTWLHASHGWPADYLPLFLSECMYRSLRIPLSVALRAS